MELLKNMVGDIAIIAIIASFMEILVPSSHNRNAVRLILGLYFMAVMLNPIIALMGRENFASLDFTEIEISGESWENGDDPQEKTDIYDVAADSIASEIDGRLGAMYEDYQIASSVAMDETEVREVQVEVAGASSGKELVIHDEIKRFISSEYGIPSNHIKVAFKEADDEVQ